MIADLAKIRAAIDEYEKLPGKSMGGVVHCIVEDDNYEQHHADAAVATAREGGWTREWGGDHAQDEDIRIAEMVAALTDKERFLVANWHHSPEMREQMWTQELEWAAERVEDE